jgi:intracellular septation protein A
MTTLRPTGLSRAAVFGSVVRRSGPHLLEASLIPTALFYACLVMAGLGTAYAAALVWLYASVGVRLARRRPIPPLLVLGVVGITVRTTVAVASGSSFFYFAQPVANSVVMTGVFLISIVVGRPMIEKLALEFWPLTPELLALPSVSRLLRGLTYLWAGVNLAIGATTLTLLVCLPLATYVAVKQLASLAITGTGIAITIDRSLRVARQEGYVVEPHVVPRFEGFGAIATAVD